MQQDSSVCDVTLIADSGVDSISVSNSFLLSISTLFSTPLANMT